MVGGILSKLDASFPAYFATVIYILDIFLVFFFLPETRVGSKETSTNSSNSISSIFGSIIPVLKSPEVGIILIIYFLFALSVEIFAYNFALWAAVRKLHSKTILIYNLKNIKEKFKIGPTETGFIRSFQSVVEVLNQTFGIRLYMHYFDETHLILGSIFILMFAYGGMILIESSSMLVFLLVPLTLSRTTISTLLFSKITKSITKEKSGLVLGVSDSLESLSRIICPTFGGILIHYSLNLLPFTSIILLSITAINVYSFFFSKVPESKIL